MSSMRHSWNRTWTIAIIFIIASGVALAEVLTPEALMSLRRVTSAVISPDGKNIAYLLEIPRTPGDDPGASYTELHVWSVDGKTSKGYITGKVHAGSPQWSPDGKTIAFLLRRGDRAVTQVWTIRVDGGEAAPATASPSPVQSYRWHPSGSSIGYIAEPPRSAREKALEGKGYGFIFYEENLRHRTLYLVSPGDPAQPRQLTSSINVWSFEFSPDGATAAVAASARNLVDDSYMFQRIHRLVLRDTTMTLLFDPNGKLGVYAFSPDGARLAVAAALGRSDHAVSQGFVVDVAGRTVRNITPPSFRGHINWVGWQDARRLLYRAGEGVDVTLSSVNPDGTGREVLYSSAETGVTFSSVSTIPGLKRVAFAGQTLASPGDLFLWSPGDPVERLTTVNPDLARTELGKQTVVRYRARDGVEIEGVLISPVRPAEGQKPPLIVLVHGGPESHYANTWITSYGEPGQVLAGKGYAVFYPNYRASTGYGVAFAAAGYGDPAGKEFDDIADAIDHLTSAGIADRARVGIGGGSYGGYAAGWFATYYTRYVRAAISFVGVSNLISRNSTTDIAYEELYVHSGKPLEEMWDLCLKRSPVYWAKQSSTATLICGGADDTRVHPSQSMELYRRMKMNDHPAVRLVQYPGEQHGNARQPGRWDLLLRSLDWYDWYVRDAKPLNGPMPPLDIADRYGLGDLPR